MTLNEVIMTIAVSLAFFWLVSCASLKVHDKTICAIGPGNFPALGARCNNVYTSNPLTLTEDQWAQISHSQPGWYCVSGDDMANIKIEIEQACSMVKCSYEQRKQIEAAFQRILNLPSTMPSR